MLRFGGYRVLSKKGITKQTILVNLPMNTSPYLSGVGIQHKQDRRSSEQKKLSRFDEVRSYLAFEARGHQC